MNQSFIYNASTLNQFNYLSDSNNTHTHKEYNVDQVIYTGNSLFVPATTITITIT